MVARCRPMPTPTPMHPTLSPCSGARGGETSETGWLLLGLRAKPLQQRLPRAEALLVAQTKDFAEHVLKLWPVLSQDVEGKREKLRRRDLALWARQTPNVSSVPAVQRRAKSETVSSLTQL